ncbi:MULTISPECIES: CapA family protein [Protofrankia]|uniref:Capsule synthesis protein, CapA n=1 Tax=Candidatus Protofrankia datiscae TaxID=2716812 RepID=F8B5E6_9ACTN|nr:MULTISPECIES: CapA family protein [Protofrankia]AEH07998.1 Capsule synthesis protein, CapA [Candidatus Protofrankia datiscae]
MGDDVVTIVFCGDTMLGRGVDQILPCPGDPTLLEGFVRDARSYVELAEAVNGPIPHRVDAAWPWGDALAALDAAGPAVRVLNLETSVTWCDDFAPGKAVHYRMNPDNLGCLAAGRPDVCVLANNHVLDFGPRELAETLDALSGAGLRHAGAGRDADEARRPAIVPCGAGESDPHESHRRGRVLVFACGVPSSGIPPGWAATDDRAGIDVVERLTDAAADELAARARGMARASDVVAVSIHWGSNWGYEVDDEQIAFAHRLVDGGVDILFGHSSHHPRPVEVYRDRLILYGCGDFIDDYEGIAGYEPYRDDLRLAYLVSVSADPADTGTLAGLRMVPLRSRLMRLRRACVADRVWLCDILDQISRGFGARFDLTADGLLALRRA